MLLQDILDAIDEIIDVMPAIRAEFDANKLVRSHVLRHIQIIGEAAGRISKSLRDQYPATPWRRMSSMRHILVHDYFQVDWDEVYHVAQSDIPPLKIQIDVILAALPPQNNPRP